MHTMLTVVPNFYDKVFQEFISDFCVQQIRPAKGLHPSNYHDDGLILEVPLESSVSYPANYCWFNCLEHCLKHGGGIVFGWGIWQLGSSHFVAQHHAVWRSPDEVLLDLTPNGISKTVMFIPDNDAPFDFRNLKCPLNFEWKGPNSGKWFASSELEDDRFSLAELQPTVSEKAHFDRICQLATERNLI